MTTTPNGPSSDPNVTPDERPAGDPSRPHGDPVAPDPAQVPGQDDTGAGSPADPQDFPPTDPEAEPETEEQPGQLPTNQRLDVNG